MKTTISLLFALIALLCGCGDDMATNHSHTDIEGSVSAKTVVGIPPLFFPTTPGAKTSLAFGADWKFAQGCDGKWKKHTGVDLAVTAGSPVYAADTGRVVVVGSDPVWRGYITISHVDPSGATFTTVYWHVVPKVKVGDRVARGARIADVAQMSGAHLHFGVRMAAYANTSNRGALPATKSCGPSDPRFAERFTNPAPLF